MVLVEKDDFYWDESGLMIFTREYHLKRGYCCKNRCRHCPWKFGQLKKSPQKGQAEKK